MRGTADLADERAHARDKPTREQRDELKTWSDDAGVLISVTLAFSDGPFMVQISLQHARVPIQALNLIG